MCKLEIGNFVQTNAGSSLRRPFSYGSGQYSRNSTSKCTVARRHLICQYSYIQYIYVCKVCKLYVNLKLIGPWMTEISYFHATPRHGQMVWQKHDTKTSKMASKFKMAEMLLRRACCSKRLFCASRRDTDMYQFPYQLMKHTNCFRRGLIKQRVTDQSTKNHYHRAWTVAI